jgi:hypothetical protein
MDAFLGFLMDVEMERDYYKALLHGTWPQSEVIHKAYLQWQKDRFKELT